MRAWLVVGLLASSVVAEAGLATAPGGAPGEEPLAAPARPAEADTRPVIASVDFEGVRDADLGAMRDLLHIHDPGVKLDDDDPKEHLVTPGLPLDRANLAKALRALHHTGRFSSVRAWASDAGPGRVALKFSMTPRLVLSSLVFDGARALDQQVLTAAANLPLGTEYLPSRANAAAGSIANAYFRAGYRRASVSTRPETAVGSVLLHFAIVEGDPTRVAAIAFTPPTGLDADVMRTALGVRPGDVLDLDRLAEGTKHLLERYRKDRYLRAEIAEPRIELIDALHARVVVPVEPGPRLTFLFRGAVSFTDELLSKKLGYDSEEPLDDAKKNELASRLRAFYESMGFLQATVVVRETPAREPGKALVAFSISEGSQRHVTEVRFTGNKRFTSEELASRVKDALDAAVPEDPYGSEDPGAVDVLGIAGRPPNPRAEHFKVAPESIYVARIYDQALKQIENLYKSEGYLDAHCLPPRLKPQGSGRIRVDIEVKEGVRTLVGGHEFHGAAALSPEALTKVLKVKDGDPLSYYAVEQDRTALLQAYGREGYIFARVEDEEEFNADRTRAKVIWEVTEGPQVRVSRVELRGFHRTAHLIADDAVELHAGDVLDPEKMLKSQQNLIQSALFLTATVGASDPDIVEPLKAVVVTVRENPRDQFELSGGASLTDGPRAVFTWTRQNDFGYGEQLSLAAKVNVPVLRYAGVPIVCPNFGQTGAAGCAIAVPTDFLERQIDLSYTLPRVYALSRDLTLRADVLHVRAVRPAYALENLGGLGTAGFVFTERLRAQVQLGVELDSFVPHETLIATNNVIDLQRSRLPDGVTALWTVGGALSLDYRDDPRNPGRGFLVQLAAERDQSFFAQYNDGNYFGVRFDKPSATLSGYVPLGRPRWVLALSARAGVVLPELPACPPGGTAQPTACSVTIAPKRFYLGGSQSLRGFGEESLVPQNERAQLANDVVRCRATVTGSSCTPEAAALLAGAAQPSTGGEAYGLAKVELRFPLLTWLDGGLFLDAGNLWSDRGGDAVENVMTALRQAGTAAQFLQNEIRYAVGGGARIPTPMGPFSIDVGFNLAPDLLIGEQPRSFFFSLGLF